MARYRVTITTDGQTTHSALGEMELGHLRGNRRFTVIDPTKKQLKALKGIGDVSLLRPKRKSKADTVRAISPSRNEARHKPNPRTIFRIELGANAWDSKHELRRRKSAAMEILRVFNYTPQTTPLVIYRQGKPVQNPYTLIVIPCGYISNAVRHALKEYGRFEDEKLAA